MKKIFNNSKRILNAAMLMAVIVAASLFTSCSKETVKQNDPIEEKKPTTATISLQMVFSYDVLRYYTPTLDVTDSNGKNMSMTNSSSYKQNLTTDLALYNPKYEVSTFPAEITVKAGLELNEGASEKFANASSATIAAGFKYTVVTYTTNSTKLDSAEKGELSNGNFPEANSFEQLKSYTQSSLENAKMNKTYKIKIDAQGKITVE